MLAVAVALALLVGVALGLLGGGGSILTVPILRYVLGLEGHSAIAMSLFVVGATSLAGLVAHARRGRVQWRTGLVFGGAGMLGAYLAGRVAHFIAAELLLVGFGLMMFATALAMLRPPRASGSAEGTAPAARAAALPVVKILAEGLVVGAVTGFVGAGGGFLVVPALVLLGNLPMEIAVGTSLLVITLKSFAGFFGFLGHTPMDWPLALVIASVAIVGSVGGSALAARAKPETLRAGFGWFVVSMAFFTLAEELPPLFGGAVSFGLALLVAVAGSSVVYAIKLLVQRRPARPEPPVPPLLEPPSVPRRRTAPPTAGPAPSSRIGAG